MSPHFPSLATTFFGVNFARRGPLVMTSRIAPYSFSFSCFFAVPLFPEPTLPPPPPRFVPSPASPFMFPLTLRLRQHFLLPKSLRAGSPTFFRTKEFWVLRTCPPFFILQRHAFFCFFSPPPPSTYVFQGTFMTQLSYRSLPTRTGWLSTPLSVSPPNFRSPPYVKPLSCNI